MFVSNDAAANFRVIDGTIELAPETVQERSTLGATLLESIEVMLKVFGETLLPHLNCLNRHCPSIILDYSVLLYHIHYSACQLENSRLDSDTFVIEIKN